MDLKEMLGEASVEMQNEEAVRYLKDLIATGVVKPDSPHVAVLTVAHHLATYGILTALKNLEDINKMAGTRFPVGDGVAVAAFATAGMAFGHWYSEKDANGSFIATFHGAQLASTLLEKLKNPRSKEVFDLYFRTVKP